MPEAKQPIRLTQQRAEALLAVLEAGVRAETTSIRDAMQYASLRTADEMADLKARDVRLAAAKDAAAIVRHRYLHGEEPTQEHTTLF